MIDPKFLKENPGTIRSMLESRNFEFPLDELIAADKRRRELILQVEELRRRRNLLSHEISAKIKNHKNSSIYKDEIEGLESGLVRSEREKKEVEINFRRLMMTLPNLISESVPKGASENDNIILKYHGSIKRFDFDLRDHVDIGNALGLLDIERAAKISGARFYFLKNELVRLNQALINFALDFLHEKGYVLTQPPFMIKRDAIEGAVILGDLEDMIYKIENDDLYLIGTSEHSIASMHMNEILDGKDLPLRYASCSPCFRKEAGAHGKDTKGIFRVHQFEKVEQFVYARPEQSEQEHDRLLSISEEFYEKLGIPYRTVLLCSADLGKVSHKTYDIEAWMPAQNAYREMVSCSDCTDYQARRLLIRFRDTTSEQTRYVHTLNSTLVATERTMACIMETYQMSDRTIKIPEVLQQYMRGTTEIQQKNSAGRF
ncbi:MAG TPA: serine--tRNA ligase [Candidatus Nitrosopolaris sp.]|nr:serine--tRNA ligase [Candidatus Nitrosopolaris sp.]